MTKSTYSYYEQKFYFVAQAAMLLKLRCNIQFFSGLYKYRVFIDRIDGDVIWIKESINFKVTHECSVRAEMKYIECDSLDQFYSTKLYTLYNKVING